MATQVSYPGVYIEEFAPGAPIQSAATNIAAFLGPLAKGPITRRGGPYKLPLKVTSLDQFYDKFGRRPAPGFFTWYAVRGFFENGGKTCYVYRVSNADYARIQDSGLTNQVGAKLADVFALVPGLLATPVTFEVKAPASPLLVGATLFSAVAQGTIDGTEISINPGGPGDNPPTDARAFRINDSVMLMDATGAQLGALTKVKSATAGKLVIKDKFPKQPVTVKLVYDSGDDIRVTVPDPTKLPVNALTAGATVIIGDPTNPAHVSDVIQSVSGEQLTAQAKTFRLQLRNGLQNKIDPAAAVPVSTVTFDVSITQGGASYLFSNLAPDSLSDDYYVTKINKYPSLVWIVPQDPPPMVLSAEEMAPKVQPFSVSGGADEKLPDLADKDFTDALDDIRKLGDVRLVSAPDGYPRPTGQKPAITKSVYAGMIAHCEQMADRFAVIDPPPGLGLFGAGSIEEIRVAVDSARGYAGLYYPWVRVSPAGTGPLVTVPPSGHVCGLMAFVDSTKGVHKAPANEILAGTVGVELTMTDAEHGLLNLQGINVIRVFRDGGRPYVYGARTTATDGNWKYVNVRRLFLYLEKSIQDGIRWAVFEPNNHALWDKLRQTIRSFLLTEWKAGALFGESQKQAYYVRIDEVLNPFTERTNGRLNIEIGIQPTYPAEFIVVRIGIWDGGAEVTEG